MKASFLKIAFLIFITTCSLKTIAQTPYNKQARCIKTIWVHLGGSYQIDSYNFKGQHISTVQVNIKGDTTQLMTTKYDSLGREIESCNSVISYDTKYKYFDDSVTIIRINKKTKSEKKNTSLADKKGRIIANTNNKCSYKYNISNKITLEICYNKVENEKDSTIYIYDKKNNCIKEIYFQNDKWRWTTSKKFNERNLEVKETHSNSYGNKRTTFSEYNVNGKLSKTYGTDRNQKWEMCFDYYDCN